MENETDYLDELTPEERGEAERAARQTAAEEKASREERLAEELYDPEHFETARAEEEATAREAEETQAGWKRAKKEESDASARQTAGLHGIALSQAIPAHQRERADWERRWNNATPEQIPALRAEGEQLAAKEHQIRESLEVVNRTKAVHDLGIALPWLKNPQKKEAFLEWAEERYDVTREEAMAITDPHAIYAAGKRFERHMEKQEQAKQAEASDRAKKAAAQASAKKAWDELDVNAKRYVTSVQDGKLNPLNLYDGPHKDYVSKHGAKVPKGASL
jgi:hypothetical protein